MSDPVVDVSSRVLIPQIEEMDRERRVSNSRWLCCISDVARGFVYIAAVVPKQCRAPVCRLFTARLACAEVTSHGCTSKMVDINGCIITGKTC